MRLLTAAALTACVALPLGSAHAGPLTSERVPEGANFVVHVDVEALHDSRVGRALLEIALEQGGDDLHELEDELGFNPIEALHDVTISGSDQEGEDVVIVATGHEELLKALDRLREEADEVDELEAGGIEFTRFAGHDGGHGAINIWVRETRDGVVIVASPDEDALVRGVNTLRGRKDGAEVRGAPRDAFVVVTAHSLDGMDAGPASAVLQLSKGVLITIGEDDDDLSINLRLHAEDDEGATALVQMLQGIVAFAQVGLREEMDDDRVLGLLGGLTFDSRGAEVNLGLRIDPDTLEELLDD